MSSNMHAKFALTLNVGLDRHKQVFDSISHDYVRFFDRLGIVPVLIPNAIQDVGAYLAVFDIEGVILTGGNDISPRLYGQELTDRESISDDRDRIETALLQMAIQRDLPVLGICRGMQIINVFFGGSLTQDVKQDVGTAVNHVGHSHLNIVVDENIEKLLNASRITVNSFHNQGVTPKSMARDLKAFAISEKDGLTEGILHPVYPILGIQWHPERPGSSIDTDLCLIENFLQGTIWKKGALL